MTLVSRSRVISRGTSASGTCTVASTTFSGSDQNIIATRGLPVRWPSRSVWPFQGRPARANASLLTGAVAMAATRSGLRVAHGGADRVVRGAARLGREHARRETRDPDGGP